MAQQVDSLPSLDTLAPDSTLLLVPDTLSPTPDTPAIAPDSLPQPAPRPDSVPTPVRNFLEDIIKGSNLDSLVYEPGNKMVYIYEKGDVFYQNMELKGDYMAVDLATKNIHAHGRLDSIDAVTGREVFTRPEFIEVGSSPYQMDTIAYNLSTKKAKVYGLFTKEGEGYLHGQSVKMMPDNTINIQNGRYTTCDLEDHPHFYIQMWKAKAIPGKKIIVGPSWLVFEDVPLYFLAIPMGFFPMVSERSSGFIVPEYGEDGHKGFFLRNGGYYFALNDYIDATVTGGIYTLGSWEGAISSRYTKKYKFSGNLSANYSKNIVGEKGESDYISSSAFQITWSHTQDGKARPNSSFSASVNYASSGYNKYSATNMTDYLTSQTNSTISYSRRWSGVNLSTNVGISQSSRDSTVMLSLPNVVLSVAKIYPFRWGPVVGRQRWYQKISLSYTGTLNNDVTVKERDLFTPTMFEQMRNGVNHVIPTSFTVPILKHINFSPSINYQERWYFKKIEKAWNPEAHRVEIVDTIPGFYRVYNYSASASVSTKVYGEYQFRKGLPIQAMRHTIQASASMSFAPDFSKERYGYWKQVQSDTMGNTTPYSPFEQGRYGVPGAGQSASMSFSLAQTLEAKLRDKNDTAGFKKVAIIENFSIGGSYNFLADSMKLSTLSLSLRTAELFKGFAINLNATLDPYEVVEVNGRPVRINSLTWKRGNPGRIVSTGWSASWSLNSTQVYGGAINDINNGGNPAAAGGSGGFFDDPTNPLADPAQVRRQMVSQYYDFNLPWNIGLSYSLNYNNDGLEKRITQALSFNGSLNLTPKWGITFSGGYDFKNKKVTPGTIVLTRDLHCWQFNFQWVPIGFRSSWSFNIGVKSAMLKDLKYDKRSSFYDNLYN